MSERGNLTTGNVFGRLVSFALPFLFACFMQAFYGAVDMWTVGNFSTTAALSAVNVGAQVTQIVTGFCVGVSMGTVNSQSKFRFKKRVEFTIGIAEFTLRNQRIISLKHVKSAITDSCSWYYLNYFPD